MNNAEFTAWSRNVRHDISEQIDTHHFVTGDHIEAIIAGGEYMYAIMDDYRAIQHTCDGGYLWQGIPLFRCSGFNGVKLVWDMFDARLPEPPKGE
jgi:hypothetical protein